MKKLFISLLAIMAMVSCSESGETDNGGGNNNQGGSNTPTTPTITLSKSSVSFEEFADEEKITFSATTDWVAEIVNDRADSWLSISPKSGTAGDAFITIKANNNDTHDERNATVIIKAGSASKTINVSQKQKDALTVTSSKFEVSADGGEVTIEVKANVDFDFTIDESAKNWVTHRSTRAMKTSTLVFEVDENSDSEKRKANITITSGKLKETVTIYQESNKPSIVLTQNEYTVPSAGETIAVEVKSNVDVTVEMPADVDWITENTTRAVSTNTYYFDIETNNEYDARTAKIKFVNKENNLSETVTITQTQKYTIVIAEDSYTLSKEGGEIEIEVEHSMEFDIKIDGDWITQKQTRALETSKLTFVVAENTTYNARTGSVTFTSKDGVLSQKVEIVQNAKLCELYYTSSNGKVVTPKNTFWGGAKIVSNVYENGRGVITFDGEVTSIGIDAFNGCDYLTSITIPNCVTSIEESAFNGCSSLSSVTIPDSVTKIGEDVFAGCKSLVAFYGKYTSSDNRCIIVDGELRYFAREGLSSYKIPEGVTVIGDRAFYQCNNLVGINIPEGVSKIGASAFGYCSLSSITIPNSVTVIDWCAFDSCLTLSSVYCKAEILPRLGNLVFNRVASDLKIYVPLNSATLYKITGQWEAFAKNIIGENLEDAVTCPQNQIWYTSTDGQIVTPNDSNVFGANIVSNIYENGKGIITFDGAVTKIGWEAFSNCDRLVTISLPSEITLIDYGAFQDCSKLIGISLGNKVTKIGVNAFENCVMLYSIEIPDSVTILDRFSFSRSGIQGIIISKNIESMGEYAFQHCMGNIYCKATVPPTIELNTLTLNLKNIYVPSRYVSTYKNAENWKYFAKLIEGYNE